MGTNKDEERRKCIRPSIVSKKGGIEESGAKCDMDGIAFWWMIREKNGAAAATSFFIALFTTPDKGGSDDPPPPHQGHVGGSSIVKTGSRTLLEEGR